MPATPSGAGSLPASSRVSSGAPGRLPEVLRGDRLHLGDLVVDREHRPPLQHPQGAVHEVLHDPARVAHLGTGESLLVREVRVVGPVLRQGAQHRDRLGEDPRLVTFGTVGPEHRHPLLRADTVVEPRATLVDDALAVAQGIGQPVGDEGAEHRCCGPAAAEPRHDGDRRPTEVRRQRQLALLGLRRLRARTLGEPDPRVLGRLAGGHQDGVRRGVEPVREVDDVVGQQLPVRRTLAAEQPGPAGAEAGAGRPRDRRTPRHPRPRRRAPSPRGPTGRAVGRGWRRRPEPATRSPRRERPSRGRR